MKVANVELKAKTVDNQAIGDYTVVTTRKVETTFEEVRGWDTYSIQGGFLIFHNAGTPGDDVAYNQEYVVGFTTLTE